MCTPKYNASIHSIQNLTLLIERFHERLWQCQALLQKEGNRLPTEIELHKLLLGFIANTMQLHFRWTINYTNGGKLDANKKRIYIPPLDSMPQLKADQTLVEMAKEMITSANTLFTESLAPHSEAETKLQNALQNLIFTLMNITNSLPPKG